MIKEGDIIVVIKTGSDESLCSPDCDWYEEGPTRRCHLARAEGEGPVELLEEVEPCSNIVQAKRCETCLACFP